jgi:beta-carotene hydroxylase
MALRNNTMNWGLKYTSDWRSLLFVAICLTLLILPQLIAIPLQLALIWVPVTSLFCFSCAIITHNHLHTSIFKQQWQNQLLNLALTITGGCAATHMMIPHHYNHHKHRCNSQDWATPKLLGKSQGIQRLLRYPIEMAKATDIGLKTPESLQLLKPLKKKMEIENFVLLTFISITLILNWAIALIFVILPWFISTILLLEANLLQHDGCDSNSRFNHSRNFTGKLSNWFCFNNGYHTIHHLQPKLHWSLLPEFHNRIVKPHIDSNLEEKSIIGFLVSDYLLSK